MCGGGGGLQSAGICNQHLSSFLFTYTGLAIGIDETFYDERQKVYSLSVLFSFMFDP